VLIEKPAGSGFLPILDGGFSLEYSPLLEYREGDGLIVFCQLDVTGRTEGDPAARVLVPNILSYVSNWKPAARRMVVYAGEPAGLRHLARAGFTVSPFDEGKLATDHVLVAGPGAGEVLAASAEAIARWLKVGGKVLAIGLDEKDANAFLPFEVTSKKAEHISGYFESFSLGSPLAGVGPADVHNRDPRDLALIKTGAVVLGDGVLAHSEGSNVVFCQLVPWQFEDLAKPNIKRTYRRASFLLSRLLANMGGEGVTSVLARFGTPVDVAKAEKRWESGLYLDQAEEMDDPYRFFRW
jgi:beta-galactosidase